MYDKIFCVSVEFLTFSNLIHTKAVPKLVVDFVHQ